MRVTIFKDETINLDLDCIIDNLHRLALGIDVHIGFSHFAIENPPIITQGTYKKLPKAIDEETTDSNAVLLFTDLPYDNNYFWESTDINDKKIIVSLYGWDRLTTLPRNNGAVYFTCSLLLGALRTNTHSQNTGCINDFWLDKTGVDVGMRAAFICPDCMRRISTTASPEEFSIVEQVQAILHELSIASRANIDVCTYWQETHQQTLYDVFLCYNSDDQGAIREMNDRLKKCSIKTWFDEEQLPPGRLWQESLEENIEQVKTAAVFVGSSGIGPWQNMELRNFLQEFMRRRCPVIPVILSSCNNVPKLPLFLSQFTWVDFRKAVPDPFNQLRWGITGDKPNTE